MNKTIIIAEAGVNHNGDIKIAKKLIDIASEAGVDYVKFQTFKADKISTKYGKKADYQDRNIKNLDSQYDMLKKLELDEDTHRDLIKYCNSKRVKFLSTAFDLDSLELLNQLGIRLAKIPSGEITNYPFLKRVAQLFSNVILSTGMSTLNEINKAVKVLLKFGINKENLTILHCNTEYPTPMSDVNLKGMLHIQTEFGVKVGYSDHTLGIEVPIAAVALGARVIEKHFTLDRNLLGPDHKASLEPNELNQMVESIRNIEKAISGTGIKEPSISELKNKLVIRKSIVAIKSINKGETFNDNNIGVKRPGTGISPMRWDDIIGQTSSKDFNVDDIIVL
jgi:N,N'-diacetyllegionaminate synthase